MFEKLQGVEERFCKVEELMGDPEVVQNREAYEKYSREQADEQHELLRP